MDDYMKELLTTFREESAEIFEQLDANLLLLEKDMNNKDLLNSVFRAMHTLKGSANMMGFGNTGKLAHAFEDLLDCMRSNRINASDDMANLFFDVSDCLKDLLDAEISGKKTDNHYESYINELKDIMERENQPPPQAELIKPDGESRTTEEHSKEKDKEKDDDNTLRVDWEQLNNLMDLVDELFMGKAKFNRLVVEIFKENPEDRTALSLVEMSRNLDKLTSQIQERVMALRRVPLENELGKFNRVIRDLSREYGKDVDLKVSCNGTEIDRQIWDQVYYVLMNLMDSSVSSSLGEDRGAINIKTSYVGSDLVLDIADNGQGFPPEGDDRFTSSAEILRELRGKMEIQKNGEEGFGCRLKLPLNSSKLRVLLVGFEKAYFALPVSAIEEIVKIKKEDIVPVGGARIIPYKDTVIPLMSLGKLSPDSMDPEGIFDNNVITVLVITEGDEKIAVAVEEILCEDEILIKKLEDPNISARFIQGVTVLGDGRVIIILDPRAFL